MANIVDSTLAGRIAPCTLRNNINVSSGNSGFVSISAPNDQLGNPRYTCLSGYDIIINPTASSVSVTISVEDNGVHIFQYILQTSTTGIIRLNNIFGSAPVISQQSGTANNVIDIFVGAVASGPNMSLNLWGYPSYQPGS